MFVFYTDATLTLTICCHLLQVPKGCFQWKWYVHYGGKLIWSNSSILLIWFGITCSQDFERNTLESQNSGFYADLSTS